MQSLRLWFLFSLLNTSFVVLIALEVRRSAIQTSDWRDITVNGRGYIHTLDENGNHPTWLRSAHLGINQDSLLCARINGELRLLEPRISIPSEWMEINIDLYGRITVSDPGSAGLSIGTIPVTTFSGEEPGDQIQVTNPENRLGPPNMQLAGESNVTITKAFLIGKYKVTAEQYCQFLNSIERPIVFVQINRFSNIEKRDGKYYPKKGKERFPANSVHWRGAAKYCEWLSAKTGKTVRLPTEAEWEFTARGTEGRKTPWGEKSLDKWCSIEGSNVCPSSQILNGLELSMESSMSNEAEQEDKAGKQQVVIMATWPKVQASTAFAS